tara:strand:+ start:82 stop:333 length:252 start_codon:yes stop_codon:yes gene_type:complete
MPTYPVKNRVTGEEKELSMTMKAYDDWRKENPDWDKDWSKGCASQSTEFRWTGEAKSSGWNEVLDRASKQPGATVRKNRDYSF